jgi:membrane fusion protein (multidrug efflux system)
MNKSRTRLIVTIIVVLAVIAAIVIVALLRSTVGEEEEFPVNMAVHTGTITRATLHRFITAYGMIMPQPAAPGQAPADSLVASPMAGVVSQVHCVEGRRVARGDLLFRLDSRVAEVAVERATKALAFAEAAFNRQKELLPVEGTSKKAYQEAEQQYDAARADLAAAQTDLALLSITAPLKGTVVKINTEPGESVELNTVLAEIIDLDRLVAEVSVPSAEAREMRVGQEAEFETGNASGRVVYVGSAIDDKTGTVPVRVSIPPSAGFQPGQFVGLRIASEVRRDVLAAPERAVVSDTIGGTEGTIVLVEGDQAVHKPVKIGIREGGLVEIQAEGLKEGTVIVTDDAYAVPAEPTRIHVVKGE